MNAVRVKQDAPLERLFDLLPYQLEKYPNDRAVTSWEHGSWKEHSTAELLKDAKKLAVAFIRKSFSPGDRVVIVPVMGHYHWLVVDFACQMAGLVTVPVHPVLRAEEWDLILNETQPKVIVTADETLHETIQHHYKQSAILCSIGESDSTFYKTLFESDRQNEIDPDLEARITKAKGSDLATILYTSGSSGTPKGVMLSHENILHNIRAILTILPLSPSERVLSFLPFSHIFERASCYTYLAFGVSIWFSRTKDSFADDFAAARPVFCTCVPRVLEKMHDYLLEQTTKQHPLKRIIVRWAMKTGSQYEAKLFRSPWYFIKLTLARLLVLGKWRQRLGGRIRHMAVGAASLRPEIGKLFTAAGIKVVEGYGMTETAPLISMNRYEPGQNRFGTVGLPIPGVEIRLDEPDESGNGEILVRGPNVMMGYFGRPSLTAQVMMPDGWLRTGDVGQFVHRRFLRITDRKKDIFKTSAGKYITPNVLQAHFQSSPLIQRILVIGFQRPYCTALIVPHFGLLESWCEENHIHWTAPAFMVHNIKVQARIREEVDRLNETLPNVERIRDFVLCDHEWTPETGEITNTLKPIRHLLLKKYEKEIEKMYAL